MRRVRAVRGREVVSKEETESGGRGVESEGEKEMEVGDGLRKEES